MSTIIQSRRDTAARWTSINPVLAEGEIGFETDTNKMKVGDGTTAWTSLAYFGGAITSVNGQTGAVVLDASDVGALPDSTTIPTDTSDLTNGAGFITGIDSTSVTTALGYTPYNSSNPDGYITSSALADYQQKAAIQTLSATDSITLADNTIYNGGEQTALTIALPATDTVSFICEIDFTSGATPATLSYPNTIKWIGDDISGGLFFPVASKRYTIICAYDGVNYRFTVKGV